MLLTRFQVSPSDLEAVLCGSSLVADAAVTSVFSAAEGTEYPRAYIVPADDQRLRECTSDPAKPTPGLEKLAADIKALMEGKTAPYKW